MQFDLMSTVMGFVVGAFTGAAGKYLADKYTDQRRRGEHAKQYKKEFVKTKKRMPALFAEMKSDLAIEKNRLIREMYILPDKRVSIGFSSKARFIYYEAEHGGLRNKIDILENQGYLTDVTSGNTPVYRMSEGFVELLLKYG